MKLKPLPEKADTGIVSDWHSESRCGFMLLPDDFISGTRELLELQRRYNQ
ncbi:MAG: hypothetical protein M1510_12995 [Nitrospirae bacterium]|nr:hypothetical protein [Nitrospirota bacterium]